MPCHDMSMLLSPHSSTTTDPSVIPDDLRFPAAASDSRLARELVAPRADDLPSLMASD